MWFEEPELIANSADANKDSSICARQLEVLYALTGLLPYSDLLSEQLISDIENIDNEFRLVSIDEKDLADKQINRVRKNIAELKKPLDFSKLDDELKPFKESFFQADSDCKAHAVKVLEAIGVKTPRVRDSAFWPLPNVTKIENRVINEPFVYKPIDEKLVATNPYIVKQCKLHQFLYNKCMAANRYSLPFKNVMAKLTDSIRENVKNYQVDKNGNVDLDKFLSITKICQNIYKEDKVIKDLTSYDHKELKMIGECISFDNLMYEYLTSKSQLKNTVKGSTQSERINEVLSLTDQLIELDINNVHQALDVTRACLEVSKNPTPENAKKCHEVSKKLEVSTFSHKLGMAIAGFVATVSLAAAVIITMPAISLLTLGVFAASIYTVRSKACTIAAAQNQSKPQQDLSTYMNNIGVTSSS